MNRIRSIGTVLLRTGISLAAGTLTLLLVPEMVAPVSAANRIVLFDQFANPAGDSGRHDIDSSDGLIDAQITLSYGTIHSRPAMNPTTPPAPQAVSVAPTYPSSRGLGKSEGFAGVRNKPGIDR
jgi:hypothetical protein